MSNDWKPKRLTAEERATLQSNDAKRAQKRLDEYAENADALLQLREKFSEELGPEGARFEVVDLTSLSQGYVVVKLGESVIHQRFLASKRDEHDVEEFVSPCIAFPSLDEFRAIVAQHPDVLMRAALAARHLFGAKHEDDQGKF